MTVVVVAMRFLERNAVCPDGQDADFDDLRISRDDPGPSLEANAPEVTYLCHFGDASEYGTFAIHCAWLEPMGNRAIGTLHDHYWGVMPRKPAR